MNNVNTFYKKYLEKDKSIIESEMYKNKIPAHRKNNPEHLYSEYNLINHSKINFINYTKNKYPDYKFYAWIDFGSMNYDVINVPKNINFNLVPNKITYKCIKEIPKIIPDANEMLSSDDVYLLGSSFIIYKNLVQVFELIYEKKLTEWYENNISDDDQNLVLQIYKEIPELFHKIYHTEWFGMYHALRVEDKL